MATFKVGQEVLAVGATGGGITAGRRYTVVDVEPELVTPTFTWPEYTTVIGDDGRPCTGHSHRFQEVSDAA